MNDSFLAVNTIVVNTLCPVHIGTGDRLKQFDYVVNDDTVVVIDEKKLTDWVASDSSGRLAGDLADTIRRNGSISQLLKYHNRLANEFMAYQVEKKTPNKIRDLMPFIKTPFHRPYLPGSSLKGSLRSALLRGALLEQDDLRRWVSKTTYDAANSERPFSASEAIQAKVFVQARVERARYSNYDLNRVLVVRDSSPRAAKDLEVVEVKLLTASDNKLRDKPNVSLFVEVLRTNLTLRLPLTWQTNLLLGQEAAAELKLKEIRRLMIYLPEFCRAASLQLLQQEMEFYGRRGHDLADWYETKRDRLKASPDEVFILPLGWGSGYDAKTVTDLLEETTFRIVADRLRNTEGLGRPGNSRASDWLGPALSPKSRKVVVREDGKVEPLGWLAVAFRPVEGVTDDWLMRIRENEAALKPTIKLSVTNRVRRSAPSASPAIGLSTGEVTPRVSERKLTPPPETRPLIQTFTDLPKPGDRFKGNVWFTDDDGTIFVEIPGLSPDDFAVATISPGNNPERKGFPEGATIKCEVLEVNEDPKQPGHWLVQCQRE